MSALRSWSPRRSAPLARVPTSIKLGRASAIPGRDASIRRERPLAGAALTPAALAPLRIRRRPNRSDSVAVEVVQAARLVPPVDVEVVARRAQHRHGTEIGAKEVERARLGRAAGLGSEGVDE